MAKSNQELTTELEQLKVIVGQNADLLNKFMPELRVDLKRLDDKQVADTARTALIDDKLEEEIGAKNEEQIKRRPDNTRLEGQINSKKDELRRTTENESIEQLKN